MARITRAQYARLTGKAGDVSRTRSIGSARANRSGNALERAILAGTIGTAVRLAKLPQHGARFVGRDKAIRQEMPCDFIGTICGSGRAIYFDAKSVGEGGASLRVGDPAIVKPHQIAFLRAMRAAGAVAGLLVESKRIGTYLWLGAAFLDATAPVRWDDERWFAMGPVTSLPQFDWLVAHYGA